MKTKDGEPLGGRSTAENDFEGVDTDDPFGSDDGADDDNPFA